MVSHGRRRLVRRRLRRVIAAVLAGAALAVTVLVLRPAPPVLGVPTLVVARDVPSGARVSADDVRVEPRPALHRPRGSLAAPEVAVGAVAAGALREGEVVTTGRLLGQAAAAGAPPGSHVMSVPALGTDGLVLGPGQRVDLYRSDTGAPVASSVLVLGWSAPASPADGLGVSTADSGQPGSVVVAAVGNQAEAIAQGLGGGGDLGLRIALTPTR